MAKEVAILKRAKISQAQQYMFVAVLVAAVFLGAALALVLHFINKIGFNIEVIGEAEKAIVAYSDTIKNIGVCAAPKGNIYSSEEIAKCNPGSIRISDVSGTLRANIMGGLAENEDLYSVPKKSSTGCINPLTKKNYTYFDLQEIYDNATTEEEVVAASKMMQSCSALRVIPDALPAVRNEEALLASLNQIFLESDWEPDALTPSEDSSPVSFGSNLNTLALQLSVEASSATTLTVLNNVERSIRDFNFERATIEWASAGTLNLQAYARAYYVLPAELNETTKTINPGEDK